MKTITLLSVAFCVSVAGAALAEDPVSIPVNKISAEGIGEKAGTMELKAAADGVSLMIDVKGVTDGEHGFHVHENGDCGPGVKDGKPAAGLAAGGHYDPVGTKSHKGPDGMGHQGDLPKLIAKDQTIKETVTITKMKMSDVAGRSIVIHEGGDNYSDTPENGGGKGRIMCAVVPKKS